MRQIYGRLLLLVTTALLIMAGCTPEGGKDKEFDESFLYGKWYLKWQGLNPEPSFFRNRRSIWSRVRK